ncbi:MAG: NfeD family protein [Alphaproteobacteria bacterium]
MIASLIIALHLLGFISLESAVTSLYVAGTLLIIAELGVISFGLITINALIALYAGYALQNGGDFIFDVAIGWPILFGIAFVEFALIATIISIFLWLKNKKISTGIDSMIGAKATVTEWDETKGTIRFEGEIWSAYSDQNMDLTPEDMITIESVEKLRIKVTA